MAARPVRLRELAAADLAEAVGHYGQQAGQSIALGFIDAVERAIHRISRNPQIGTARYGHELGISDLRASPVGGFPYAVFYIGRDEAVDVWRVLHTSRDIPTSLREPI